MLIVPCVTPFKDESVDHDAVAPMLDFLADRGVRALFPLGTTGEFSSLSLEERRDTLTTFVESASGRFEIIAHIGAATRREVIALGEHALGLGVHQAAVVTPYYFGYRQSDLEAFFREVSLALPDLRLYAYTIPGRAGNTLDTDTVARLAELPNVVGIKDSSGDMRRLLALLDLPGLTVFAGADALALPFMRAGGAGLVSGLGAVIPEVFSQFFKALESGDAAAQARLFALIRRFDALMLSGSRIDFIRLGLAWRGVNTGMGRAPQPQPSADERLTLQEALDDFGRLLQTQEIWPTAVVPA